MVKIFKKGDKVIPKLNRVTVQDADNGIYHPSMKHLFNKEHTILLEVLNQDNLKKQGRSYITKEGYNCIFAEHWLEPVDQIETESFFDKAYVSLARMQNEKNKRYGESALKPLDIFTKHHSYGSRLDEKLARVKNSNELRKNDLADIIGGVMLICKDKGWDSFDDLID